MSRHSRPKRSTSAKIMWALSIFLVASMVISLFVVALPSPPTPTPTWPPTFTPIPHPTATPSPLPPEPSPTAEALPTAEASPTAEATHSPASPTLPAETPTPALTLTVAPSPTGETEEPPVGPVLPTDTPTVTPTLTATPAAAGFTFAVCGDSRGNPAVYRRVLEAVTADGSEFLVHLGDLVNEGREDLWQEFAQIMAGFPLPFYPVAGNHDGLGGKLEGFLKYSGAPAAHYSFDRPPVHLAFADSHNGGLTTAELAWLRDDLSATAQPLRMVFLHHPPFDPDGTDHIMAFGNRPFMALMAEMQVDYVFAGHIHAYARAERDGVVYLYSGGAGAPLYTAGHPQAFYHYLRVTVQGEQVLVEVVKV